jgi:uncharacterized protein YdiU (UPF0061 family)
MDYTISFDLLTKSLTSDSSSAQMKQALEQTFDQWRTRINEQTAPVEDIQALMRRHNPTVIPRNHHIEAVLKECGETGMATSAEAFLRVLRHPYQETEQTIPFQSPPQDNDSHYQTFCGT